MRTSGIYKIQSIARPDRCYIGSSKDIFHRWHLHLSDLSKEKHHSIKLQRHFNKYSQNDLQFSILESFDIVSKEGLISREQHYIDLLNPYFNSSKTAGSRLGIKTSEETRQKQRERAIINGNKPPSHKGVKASEETKRKMKGRTPWNKGKPLGYVPKGAFKKGENMGENNNFYGKHHTAESNKKNSDAAKKRWVLLKHKKLAS